ncbi:hypothetical protein ACFL2K_01000 [Candidatus Margulisiibacteriota bacterium]
MNFIGLLLIMLLSAIYFPVSIIYSIIWGILAGLIGTTVGTYEDWRDIINADIFDWKKNPKRKNLRYWRSHIHAARIKAGEAKKIIQEAYDSKRTMPTPLWIIPYWTVYYLIMLIIRWFVGVFCGPFHAFDDALDFWYEKILKKPRKKDLKLI